MQQFCEMNCKAVVSAINPLSNGLQLVCHINKLDNHGNFTKREILYITLFNAAEKSATKRCVKPGDMIIIRNAEYNTFINPHKVMYVSFVCNYANQIELIANGNHDTLDARKMKEI